MITRAAVRFIERLRTLQAAPSMSDTTITRAAMPFIERLRALKAAHPPSGFTWYGYDIMSNVWHLEGLLEGRLGHLLADVCEPIADIGAADGDLGFFMESLGHRVDFIDWPQTNWNGLRGLRSLHGLLESSAEIHEVDVDTQFNLARERYGLVISLGILYHLKNPFYVLERLAQHSDRLLLSTRIASRTPDGGRMDHAPLAYLLDPQECNQDATNFWIFSEPGLRRLLERSGWRVEAWRSVGCTVDSEPAHPDRDERAFVYARSLHAAP